MLFCCDNGDVSLFKLWVLFDDELIWDCFYVLAMLHGWCVEDEIIEPIWLLLLLLLLLLLFMLYLYYCWCSYCLYYCWCSYCLYIVFCYFYLLFILTSPSLTIPCSYLSFTFTFALWLLLFLYWFYYNIDCDF